MLLSLFVITLELTKQEMLQEVGLWLAHAASPAMQPWWPTERNRDHYPSLIRITGPQTKMLQSSS